MTTTELPEVTYRFVERLGDWDRMVDCVAVIDNVRYVGRAIGKNRSRTLTKARDGLADLIAPMFRTPFVLVHTSRHPDRRFAYLGGTR